MALPLSIESRRFGGRVVEPAFFAGAIQICFAGVQGVEMNRSWRLFNRACNVGSICISLVILLLTGETVQGMTGVESRPHADAVRLNNIGTALMNQQLLEKAIDKFEEAYRLDRSLTVAELK